MPDQSEPENGAIDYGQSRRITTDRRAPLRVAYRATIEYSYLFTSYNRTPHQHLAGDIVTTVRLAETEMKIKPKDMVIVADRDIGLTAFVAWTFICSRVEMGPFAGDLRGMDLADPASWTRHAYMPLVLRGGGVMNLVRLCKGRRAFLSGVRQSCRKLFPATFKVQEKSRSVEELVEAAASLA